jgi:group I intron endonuclease
MQKFKGIIYQAINIQNNKSYIGKTVRDFEEYKLHHIDSALNKKTKKRFYDAIRKYKPENFKWIVLGEIECYNLEDLNQQLNEAEIESIWIFRTFGSDGENYDNTYGYNMTKGGDGVLGYIHPENTRKQMSVSHTGSKHSLERCKNMSKSMMGKNLNKKHTLETIIDMKEKRYGKNNVKYKYINYTILINMYFTGISNIQMIDEYNKILQESLTIGALEKFYKILNIPKNVFRYKKPREDYLKFVEENKHKIDWYIDNYERLEEEYFENKKKL